MFELINNYRNFVESSRYKDVWSGGAHDRLTEARQPARKGGAGGVRSASESAKFNASDRRYAGEADAETMQRAHM